MATFYVQGKPNFTILDDDLGIFHVIEKFLCAMFGFQLGTLHISKDNAFDDNNNVTLDPSTKFHFRVPMDWDGLSMLVDSGLLAKTSPKALKTLSSC
jgi:hypothetical protein